MNDVLWVGLFLAARKGMDGGPLLAVLTEFEDDLAAEDACRMLECVRLMLSEDVPVAPVTIAEGIVLDML